MSEATPDLDRIKAFIFQVYRNLEGAVVSGMIYLGSALGLYKAMSGAGPLTSEDLARKTGLHERWVREWLRGQAAAKLIEYKGDGRFELSLEGCFALAIEESPAYSVGGFTGLPEQFAVLKHLPESFRTGIGLTYDILGPEGNRGVELMLAPWYRSMLVPIALPALEGVVPKLEAGAKVADVGCGAGVALIEMAKAFPRSKFHGYDIAKHALAHAEKNKAEAGVANVTFHDASADAIPGDASFDFVTSFDCLHDMTRPDLVTRAIRAALKPDGTWLICDINSKPTFEENLERNPMVALMYGFSIMSCMSSALSEPGGLGLGTLGFTEEVARRMTSEAGFTRFQRHDFDNPMNAYYEVRP
jgi:2-polyprenyl-3-methyl-5-hydroxy-6-metoxy-1,4-benzoquinol methylase